MWLDLQKTKICLGKLKHCNKVKANAKCKRDYIFINLRSPMISEFLFEFGCKGLVNKMIYQKYYMHDRKIYPNY